MTKMYRKTTCNGCGFTQTATLSYYLDAKAWRTSHTLAVHDELWDKKNDLARGEFLDFLLAGRVA
jgi:hypothetical protein